MTRYPFRVKKRRRQDSNRGGPARWTHPEDRETVERRLEGVDGEVDADANAEVDADANAKTTEADATE